MLGSFSVPLRRVSESILKRFFTIYLKTSLKFDFTKNDCNAPSVTSLKILKGDSLSLELIHGAPASISLTAGDFEFPYTYPYVICHQVASMQLFVKNFNESLWTEITVIPQSSIFDTLTGMQYIADLGQVLTQFPDSAWIDLKISTSDASGNNTEEILHPAFLVRDQLVSVANHNNKGGFSLYPNPARNEIILTNLPASFEISIYTADGRQVMQETTSGRIDVSGLPDGLYLIRLMDNSSGKIYLKKFIIVRS